MSASEQPNGTGGDPLARIGARLIGAAVERRRRRRHARQRIAGALVTVLALLAVIVVARPFDGGGAPAPPAGRVELSAPGGRFAVYAGEHGALCADRPNGRDPAGTTSCASPPLVEAELASDGLVWLSARVEGERVVVTGLAETGAERVVLSTRATGGGQAALQRTLLREPPVTVAFGGERVTVRPFVATVPSAGGDSVRVDVARPDGRVLGTTVAVGDARPSGIVAGRALTYRVEGGQPAARVAELAQARVAAVGPGLSQVIGDGDRLTVELPSRTAAPAAAARAALAPGVLRFYDWEASVQLTDGRTVAEGLVDGAPRATAISRSAGAADGMPLALAETLAQVPERLGGSHSPGRLMPTRPHGTVVQALGAGGRASSLPRDDPRARFYVVRGRPALTGAELVEPRAVTGAGAQSEVLVDFTAQGRRAFQRVTRTIARRGQALMLPGVGGAEVAQHVAIVLDGRLLSVAAVDPARFPDGIGGRDGALIAGGLTTRSAEQLAQLLALGPLPAMREIN